MPGSGDCHPAAILEKAVHTTFDRVMIIGVEKDTRELVCWSSSSSIKDILFDLRGVGLRVDSMMGG
jgi:hypothetical protein